MKCDKGSDAWNKFEDITNPRSSYQSWPTCTAKDKRGVRKSLAKEFFSGKDGLFHMKDFRTTLIYIQLVSVFTTICHISVFVQVCPKHSNTCCDT